MSVETSKQMKVSDESFEESVTFRNWRTGSWTSNLTTIFVLVGLSLCRSDGKAVVEL